MNDILIKFIKKLDTLPEEVKFFHSSNLSSNYIDKLVKKHGIDKNKIYGVMAEILANDFEFGVLENYSFGSKDDKRLILDIIGYLFLPIDQYLENVDIAKELNRRGGNVLDYGINISELIDAIENEKDSIINMVISNFDKAVSSKEEKEAIFGFIGSDLVNILHDETDAPECINASMINLLFKEKDFKDEIGRALFTNGEMLTHSQFELDGKPQSPTIGNWIQDFIRYAGSGMFNNLTLTKYITESENPKRLPQEEKRLVQKLLQLYRNIKFFPESLQDVPVEEWEIIPVNRERATIGQTKGSIGVPRTEEEKKIEALKVEEAQFSAGGLEALAIEEEIENKKKLESLKIEANRYAAGSLERMAVEEEIRRLVD